MGHDGEWQFKMLHFSFSFFLPAVGRINSNHKAGQRQLFPQQTTNAIWWILQVSYSTMSAYIVNTHSPWQVLFSVYEDLQNHKRYRWHAAGESFSYWAAGLNSNLTVLHALPFKHQGNTPHATAKVSYALNILDIRCINKAVLIPLRIVKNFTKDCSGLCVDEGIKKGHYWTDNPALYVITYCLNSRI